jgi:undecaprenyl-diphosphatase
VDAFRTVNDLPAALLWLVWPVMQLGSLAAVPVYGAVAALLRQWRLAAALLVAGGGAYLLAKVVKEAVGRGRPGALLEDVVLRGVDSVGGGYISGHAAVAVATAMVVHHYLGKRGRIVVWILAATVAFARVYVGAHLPLDVIGGAAVGCAVGLLTLLLIHPHKAVIRNGRPRPEDTPATTRRASGLPDVRAR